MRRLTVIIVQVVILITAYMCMFWQARAAENLLVNPSFENGLEGWRITSWNTEPGSSVFRHEKGGGRTGVSCVTVENFRENDARLVQTVRVVPGKKYRLAVWTKTQDVGETAKGACVSVAGYLETSPDVKGTNTEWTLCEMYLVIEKGIETVDVTLCLGGYSSVNTGKAFFDDASFTEIDEIPAGAVVTTVKKSETEEKNAETPQAGNPVRQATVLRLSLVGLALTAVAYYHIRRETTN